MNIRVWILLIFLLLVTVLFFLPLIFRIDVKGETLELQFLFRLKLFGITVFRREIYYDERKGEFRKRKNGAREGKPVAFGKGGDFGKAVLKAIDVKRLDYSLYLGGENVYSTMQITAFLECLGVFLSDHFAKRCRADINSGIYYNFDFRSGLDIILMSIFYLSVANIIGNLIRIKWKKGVKKNGVRQSY